MNLDRRQVEKAAGESAEIATIREHDGSGRRQIWSGRAAGTGSAGQNLSCITDAAGNAAAATALPAAGDAAGRARRTREPLLCPMDAASAAGEDEADALPV